MNNNIRKSSLYTAVNARLLAPEEVAQTFVPIQQFRQLVKQTHSILMGPRGCGKTTLLKMLTEPAVRVCLKRDPETFINFNFVIPDFEGVYIPSDVRWTEEMQSIEKSKDLSINEIEQIQRALISISILNEWIAVTQRLLSEDRKKQTKLCQLLINIFELEKTVPNFSDIKLSLSGIAATLRYVANYPSAENFNNAFDSISNKLLGHTIDVSTMCLNAYEVVNTDFDSNRKWALCYDELEISPEWLQRELLGSLRSIDQRFLLKLTWSPILPNGITSNPEDSQDFDSIRLWYSHVSDAHKFCEELAENAIRDKLNNASLSVTDVFGTSVYASEDKDAGSQSVYDRDGHIYNAMKELSEIDDSFSQLLEKHEIDKVDPYTDSIEIRDRLFRKMKPIVLLRETFGFEGRRKSRKRPAIYSGKEVFFAMSEGNPRRLLNLINDLVDLSLNGSKPKKTSENESPIVDYSDQAKILSALSNQFIMYVKTVPRQSSSNAKVNLYQLVDTIGKYFSSRIFVKTFPLDIVGSFIVDQDMDEEIVNLIKVGLDKGAFVYVGNSQQDVAFKIRGSRFRLSYILAPSYKLLMRNDPAISLTACLSPGTSSEQMSLLGS